MSKVFVYLENWYEDWESHGTSVVIVTNDLRKELALISDEVEEWNVGSKGSRKVAEYWVEEGTWVKQQ